MANVDLTKAKDVNPESTSSKAPISDLPPLAGAGVNLVKWVLVLASSFIAIMFLYLILSDIFVYRFEVTSADITVAAADSSKAVNMDTAKVFKILEKVDSQKKDFHEFWLKIMQMVLLGMWLPILTALLGYIFATKQNDSR